MKARAFVGLTLIMVVTLAFVAPVHAIVVCYDYVYYRVTELCEGKGKDPAPPGGSEHYLGLGSVIDYMSKNGYVMLIGPSKPFAGNQLEKGDVIVIAGHIGFANGPDNIDHFLQVQGASGTKYPARALPPHDLTGSKRGGLFIGDTLKQFLGRPSVEQTHFGVWRREACNWTGTYTGKDTSGYTMTINLIQQPNGKVTGSWNFFHKDWKENVKGEIDGAAMVSGDTLTGKWKHTQGRSMSGSFEWKWLNKGCKSFEGAFNGTTYWKEMIKQ